MNRTYRRTKIVATVGPANMGTKSLLELVTTGVDIFRINLSHGSHETHEKVIERIRSINEKYGFHVGILGDLQGPKIRVGEIENGEIKVSRGDRFKFTTVPCVGDQTCLYLNYLQFPKDVKAGDKILVDDGKIELKVVNTNREDEVNVEVLYGGPISSNKGVNLPDTEVSLPALTEKDVRDLEFVIRQKLDWVALSFVRTAEDIRDLRSRLEKQGSFTKIIAKIEKPQAVANFDEILEETDAVMIARGDLGVEMPFEKVPVIQKQLVLKCIKRARPVIIATQMMESMIINARPTRAEAADVANAIMDGADAVMLSGETAIGKHPAKVIHMIHKIAQMIEEEEEIYYKDLLPHLESRTYLSDAVCYSSCKLAQDVDAQGIIGMTRSGYTAFMISSYRPKGNIFIFTDNEKILNTLSLVWGVQAFYYDKMVSTDDTIHDVQNILLKNGLIQNGDIVVNLASMPIHKQARTNMIKVTKIGTE